MRLERILFLSFFFLKNSFVYVKGTLIRKSKIEVISYIHPLVHDPSGERDPKLVPSSSAFPLSVNRELDWQGNNRDFS